jgi:hypothetical protein
MHDLTLTAIEARRLTDEVKADAQRLWAKLLCLYQGGAHTALDIPHGQLTVSRNFI